MKKILVCVGIVCMAVGVFAQGPMPSRDMGEHRAMFDSLIHRDGFQFDAVEGQHLFDSLMVRNRGMMDSLPALHRTAIEFSRCQAEKAYDSLRVRIERKDIGKDSLEKILDTRRREAHANLKLAIEDLRNIKEKDRAEIEKARQELKGRIEDRQKDVKGGIEVALNRLEQAKQNLETKATATTDADAIAKIQEAIKRLDAIEAHLKEVQAK
jgi:hypothetical protein